MIVFERAPQTALDTLFGEARKLTAFLRRDFLVALSYRSAFLGDWLGLLFSVFTFYFVGRLVDPAKLPTFGGSRATYMEFVASGIALSVFIQFGLGRVGNALRTEQTLGTLESLMMTPTWTATVQIGSVVYDLVYLPVRTGLFLVAIAVAFGLDFKTNGILPAALALILFIPFVWGLGMASAAATLTFRRGSGGFGLGVVVMTATSGAYFPIQLLPNWMEAAARYNPMTIAVDATRDPLLGGAEWSSVGVSLGVLALASSLGLTIGITCFRLATRRERQRGTLGLY